MKEKQEEKQIIKRSNNHLVTQSYILSTAKYSFSIFEKRILTTIVAELQSLLEGKELKGKLERDPKGNLEYTIRLTKFMPDGETNYKHYREAFRSLRTREIIYKDEKGGEKITGILKSIYLYTKGPIKIEIDKVLAEVFLDFSRGYSRYNLGVSLGLKSVKSVRMYELMSNQKRSLTYSIEKVREIFGAWEQKSYANTNNFIKRCIGQAKTELDTSTEANWTFDYEPIRHGRKITAITFTPIHRPENEPVEVQRSEALRKVNLSWFVPVEVRNILLKEYGFSQREIKNNLKTIEAFCTLYNTEAKSKIAEIWARAQDKKKPKAYLIGAIKLELDEQ